MTEESAIEVSNLVKKYGNFTAVSDLSMDVRKGEFMGLLGPNGAGKSTTLKAITGLLTPTSGEIRIQGIDIKDHRNALAHVGSVIETPEPYGDFTPLRYLSFVGRLYGLDKEETAIRSRDVLEELKMWEWRDKKISGFSKGMKQRIVISQALLSNPQIIILDEPTSGLDPRGMVEIRTILAELKKRDRTLLISTHILREVEELCGSVTMIRDGSAIASGQVSELVAGLNPEGITLEIKVMDRLTDDFITDLSGCAGVTDYHRLGDHVIKLRFKGTSEQQAEVIDVAYNSGLRLLSVNEEGANLEMLYMDLTEGEGAS